MSIIIFNNDRSTKQECQLRARGNLLDLTLSVPVENNILLCGNIQIINEHNYTVQGEFVGYNTIYRQFADNNLHYLLSDDDSIYIKPEPIPEPEPYIPTLEEIIASKISEINSCCEASIVGGVDVSIDGVIEHFSYTVEDQANIDDITQMANQTQLEQPYHCDGGNCKLYTVEQIITLYVAQKMNKTHHTTYANQLKSYVKALTGKESVSTVVYGNELTGIYLETYNEMMTQAKKIVNTVVGISI